MLITAAYALRAIRCLSTGPERPFGGTPAGVAAFADLDRNEIAAAGLLAAGIVGMGFYPAPLLDILASSVSRLAHHFGG
jgi:NADH-quinone oxidoreductase subunit M